MAPRSRALAAFYRTRVLSPAPTADVSQWLVTPLLASAGTCTNPHTDTHSYSEFYKGEIYKTL